MNKVNLLILTLVCLLSIQVISAQNVENKPIKMISGGVLCGKAVSLVKPPYPKAAKAVNASGEVKVAVIIGTKGNIESAQAISGHSLLREAAEKAAIASRFSPTIIKGSPVRVSGVIVYNFISDQSQTLPPANPKKSENSKSLFAPKKTTKPIHRKRIKKELFQTASPTKTTLP